MLLKITLFSFSAIYLLLTTPTIAQTNPINNQGTEVVLNNRRMFLPWYQWQSKGQTHLGISDINLLHNLGVDLLNNQIVNQQSVNWYGKYQRISLPVKRIKQYRYLDIKKVAKDWQLEIVNGQLKINTPATNLLNIDNKLTLGDGQLIIKLSRYTPWRLSQSPTEGFLTIEATANPELITPVIDPNIKPTEIDPNDDPNDTKTKFQVTTKDGQSVVQFPIPLGKIAQAKQTSPTELMINISGEAMPNRQIIWANGLIWKQKWLSLNNDRFPISYLEINPQQKGLEIRPIISQPNTLIGSNNLVKFTPNTLAAASINGGYFNRNNRFPLGAIKLNNEWLSSPILNRGAIAWNNRGNFKISRLIRNEILSTSNNEKLIINGVNTGYLQNGITRYDRHWADNYQSIQANELIITVEQNQITQITPSTTPNSITLPIPNQGYLLVIRGNLALNNQLLLGTKLSIQEQINPPDFANYPHIMAAGPWLIENNQIVLDGKLENFSDAFLKESAHRSAIAITNQGKLILVTFQPRSGGKGPTLAETAQLMQQLGAKDALNLDGGSSTSLYLGGQLINRSPATAARVHNGIGVFINE